MHSSSSGSLKMYILLKFYKRCCIFSSNQNWYKYIHMILLLCFLECFYSKDIKFKNRWCYLKSIGGCGKIVFKDSWVIELINNQRRKRSTAFNCKILFCFDNSNFGFAKVLMIQFIFSQKRFTTHLPPFEIKSF